MPVADGFFDTNVVLYLFSGDARKAQVAEDLLAGGGHVSVQVLNELASVARRKLGFDWAEVADVTATLRSVCSVAPLTVATHERGLGLARRYGLSIFDAMIAAAALDCGCRTLYTEDLQPGLRLGATLVVRNPFAGVR
jgi:predicted nucleic acid-binding protein